MAFIGDLYPRQVETPAAVAKGIVTACSMDQYRTADHEIRDVVRTAAEWQGTLKPAREMFKPAPPPATEADFVSAARRAYERFG
ncbi:MAG: hypothetical protein WKF96_16190 [Solirubrobacteraceae bacterium]